MNQIILVAKHIFLVVVLDFILKNKKQKPSGTKKKKNRVYDMRFMKWTSHANVYNKYRVKICDSK